MPESTHTLSITKKRKERKTCWEQLQRIHQGEHLHKAFSVNQGWSPVQHTGTQWSYNICLCYITQLNITMICSIYMCVHIYMHILYMHMCIYVYICTCVYMHIYAHVYICIYMQIYIHKCVCAYTVYIYIYMYAYIYVYVYHSHTV